MYGMHAPAVRHAAPGGQQCLRCQQWQRTRRWQRKRWSATYGDRVSPSPEVNRQRFARFVARVLNDARDRGMTDRDIETATGVGASTFHRWQRGQFSTNPDIGRVTAFCEGLGIPTRSALLALGAEDARDDPAPEPAIDPDVRKILRALADPNVSDTDKLVIRETLKMLANRVTFARRDRLKDH